MHGEDVVAYDKSFGGNMATWTKKQGLVIIMVQNDEAQSSFN